MYKVTLEGYGLSYNLGCKSENQNLGLTIILRFLSVYKSVNIETWIKVCEYLFKGVSVMHYVRDHANLFCQSVFLGLSGFVTCNKSKPSFNTPLPL